ncbi:MAG: YhbY family RNA-binding protein [Pseudomonadota bacterium]|nr:YhbY family RNA-binding protein [Pseudomonadota bacterium]
MKSLDPLQRRALRAKAHHLHAVVSIGTHGLTPAVLHEIDVNLLAHELVKLRVHSDDRAEREKLLERICGELDAAPVQHVGKVLIVYRERVEEEEAPAASKKRKASPRSFHAPGEPEQRASPKARNVASTAAGKKTARVSTAGTRVKRDTAAAPRDRRAPQGKHPPAARRRRG